MRQLRPDCLYSDDVTFEDLDAKMSKGVELFCDAIEQVQSVDVKTEIELFFERKHSKQLIYSKNYIINKNMPLLNSIKNKLSAIITMQM